MVSRRLSGSASVSPSLAVIPVKTLAETLQPSVCAVDVLGSLTLVKDTLDDGKTLCIELTNVVWVCVRGGTKLERQGR